MVSIVAISDLHGHLVDIPPCDILLIAGDICKEGSPLTQAEWLNTLFSDWLHQVPAKHIIGVAGNHDRVFESHSTLISKDLPWHYLEDTSIEVMGLHIHGTPWQLPFWGAFNKADKALIEHYTSIPKETDILISHGPPFGICDQIYMQEDLPYHAGSLALRNKILEIAPQLVVFGHIHEAHGTHQIGPTLFANVSLVDDNINVIHEPFFTDMCTSHQPLVDIF